ncbi:hypothetical protein PC129_g20501 [Phytophthora cactorum]|uniref:Uncharacterized protein n=2 Tax=Phytophthora cactorum TaxID=29920 RepID=A0A8T0Z0T6_9STRA|nr:hypothetical protein Pcac1_g1126 [Phytophthora cactorum]KAG2793562.1 hypothetical protein PC112_g23391 [Phytophthora cactorum]KAG2822504.1 hypothetical protein PC111_g10615 [Phytophthora cactorum]KAG2855650.1 hypothetical protein PC113_g12268 [Phytophthora cactorum]KAG2902115.1 hypothetical protein PC114_g12884 [Phytophthora cactorum]
MMAPIVCRLNGRAGDSDGPERHGNDKYCAYSTAALHEALRVVGYQLRYLNNMATFNCSNKTWFKKVARSKYKHLMIIGRAMGQKKGTWHCIARALVRDKHYFINSDEFAYKPNTEEGLRQFCC